MVGGKKLANRAQPRKRQPENALKHGRRHMSCVGVVYIVVLFDLVSFDNFTKMLLVTISILFAFLGELGKYNGQYILTKMC